jgi:hypothetical protein
MRDDAESPLARQLGQLVPAALAVDDDPLEPAEEPAPEVAFLRGAPREQVVRREDEGLTETEDPIVDLRRGEPLEVSDVSVPAAQPGEPDRVLEQLHGDPEPGASKEARAHRVEQLASSVAVRLGRVAEAKRRRDELDLGAGARERRGKGVVVLRRKSRRVGEEDAHRGLLH